MTSIFVSQAAADGLPTVGSVERLHPDIDALISPNATIEVLAEGFKWSEGPVWIANGDGGLPSQSLLFSDIPNNRIHCWDTQSGLSVFLEPAGFTGPASYGKERGSNGLALDTEGRLLCCEHGDRRISVLEKMVASERLLTRGTASGLTAPTTWPFMPPGQFISQILHTDFLMDLMIHDEKLTFVESFGFSQLAPLISSVRP